MIETTLGFRSLIYRKKQYISLFLICLFGTAISLFSLFMSRGMLDSLNEKALVYYGGDLVVMSNNHSDRFIPDHKNMIEKLKKIMPSDAVITERYDFSAETNVSLYYEGEEVLQRVIKAVDFEKESYLFAKMNMMEGNAAIEAGSNKILLSAPIAKKLGVKCGDSITLYLRTLTGYINTVDLEINGIFSDSSVFGMYTTYVNLDFMRKTYGYDYDFTNRICIGFPERKGLNDKFIADLQKKMEKEFKMFPLVDDKRIFYDSEWKLSEDTFALIPLKSNLTDVKILKNAMSAVIMLIIVLLVLIINAGMGSTYRVIVMKRINEIGIYMAIGMKKTSIIASLLLESLFLLLSGCSAGLVISFVLCKIFSTVNFSFIPGFSIFLTKGFLNPVIYGSGLFAVLFSIIFVTLLAVFYSVYKCVNIIPCQAISTNE